MTAEEKNLKMSNGNMFINQAGPFDIMANEAVILKKLESMEKDIKEIKRKMVDSDSIMTEDDYSALIEYREEKKAGKLVYHEHVKKELGL